MQQVNGVTQSLHGGLNIAEVTRYFFAVVNPFFAFCFCIADAAVGDIE